MPERLVIIPTYNEQENIRGILAHVFRLDPPFDVLVVDDGSPDGTAGMVKELRAAHPDRLHLIERTGKLGLGTAYITGFKWALERGYTHIFEMDADFSHDPDDLVRLYDACATGGADMSIGSRYVRGGHVRDWPWDRVLLSYCASLYVRAILWLGVRDTTAGFVCYHERVLRTVALDDIRFVGYAFQIEMKYRARLAGFRIAEVPITFIDRVKGTSKMSANIFREAVLGVWKMKFAVKQRKADTVKR